MNILYRNDAVARRVHGLNELLRFAVVQISSANAAIVVVNLLGYCVPELPPDISCEEAHELGVNICVSTLGRQSSEILRVIFGPWWTLAIGQIANLCG